MLVFLNIMDPKFPPAYVGNRSHERENSCFLFHGSLQTHPLKLGEVRGGLNFRQGYNTARLHCSIVQYPSSLHSGLWLRNGVKEVQLLNFVSFYFACKMRKMRSIIVSCFCPSGFFFFIFLSIHSSCRYYLSDECSYVYHFYLKRLESIRMSISLVSSNSINVHLVGV